MSTGSLYTILLIVIVMTVVTVVIIIISLLLLLCIKSLIALCFKFLACLMLYKKKKWDKALLLELWVNNMELWMSN